MLDLEGFDGWCSWGWGLGIALGLEGSLSALEIYKRWEYFGGCALLCQVVMSSRCSAIGLVPSFVPEACLRLGASFSCLVPLL